MLTELKLLNEIKKTKPKDAYSYQIKRLYNKPGSKSNAQPKSLSKSVGSRTSFMDRVFAMKELYASVDHLLELNAYNPSNKLVDLIKEITLIRRSVASEINFDKKYACLLKHTLGANKALEEVWEATWAASDLANYKWHTSSVLYPILELYAEEELKQCERCQTEG